MAKNGDLKPLATPSTGMQAPEHAAVDLPKTRAGEATEEMNDLVGKMLDALEKQSGDDGSSDDGEGYKQTPALNRDLHRTRRLPSPGAVFMPAISSGSTDSDALDETTNQMLDDDIGCEGSPVNPFDGGPAGTKNIICAVKVDDNHMEQALQLAKDQIIREAVQATSVQMVSSDETAATHDEDKSYAGQEISGNKGGKMCLFLLLLACALGVALVLSLATRPSKEKTTVIPSSPSESGPPETPQIESTDEDLPTLQRILDRGYLNCGVGSLFFVAQNISTVDTFSLRLCRAISGALFGSPYHVELKHSTHLDGWELLQNRSVDVTINMDTMTMDRDVFLTQIQSGVAFSQPYAYAGAVADGHAKYVDCVDRQDSFFGDCRDLAICFREGSTTVEASLSEILPGAVIVPVSGKISPASGVVTGVCNVAVHTGLFASEEAMQRAGFVSEYRRGKGVFSRDPLSMVTRENDAQWTDFCNWVMQGLLWAEVQNIDKNAADFVPASLPFGNFTIDFQAAIEAAGGNFRTGVFTVPHSLDGQILLPSSNRTGLNALNLDGTTGLLYSIPLGSTDTVGLGPTDGGTLAKILDRKRLVCGVATEQEGFATWNEGLSMWEGLDIEFCRALAAAIFRADREDQLQLEIVSLSRSQRFLALARGDIDVLAGGPASYEVDIQEPTSGVAFTLGMPYFYGDMDFETGVGDVRTLLTREDDSQWSDFCYWVVNALIYAEENKITQGTAVNMPVVSLFGERLKQMYRDAVFQTGNYGEIYAGTLESWIPRSGRNLLNTNPVGPQQYPIPFRSLF